MKYSVVGSLAALLSVVTALPQLSERIAAPELLAPRQTTGKVTPNCKNTPTSRGCWSNGFNIDTDYSTKWPNTGRTREFWLEVTNTTLAPDGFSRQVLTFNNTIPGPLISADWGDDIIIHVKNSLKNNGTAIHWHGIRQLLTSEADGVPGVTQCPIQPGDTMDYKFKATQYGSSWYHSHFTLQYGDGMVGPINIRGPTTADYDEDLGSLMLQDWSHQTVFNWWFNSARKGPPPNLENGLVNGTNINFGGSGGKRFETQFKKGRKYLIRLVNTGLDGYIRFAIDGHKFKVVATDFVPIKPYDAESVILGNGQRYDIVVEADQEPRNYWLRAVWMTACAANKAGAADEIKGIVRYDGAGAKVDPTTTKSTTIPNNCGDEPQASTIPHLAQTVGAAANQDVLSLASTTTKSTIDNATVFIWTINSSSLVLEWENPTELMILNGESPFPTPFNTHAITVKNQWVYWVIKNTGGLNHPIHLHGHDFSVIGQSNTAFDAANPNFNLDNPTRRDVATLPGNGYLALAFFTDNPGAWLMHCHIAWHASQGLALQFVERQDEIAATIDNPSQFKDTCSKWNTFEKGQLWPQDDSGI